jgi:hypothetical protein
MALLVPEHVFLTDHAGRSHGQLNPEAFSSQCECEGRYETAGWLAPLTALLDGSVDLRVVAVRALQGLA